MNDESQKGVSMSKAFTLFWKNYVNFSGKSSRSEYWWWYLWNLIIGFVLSIPILAALPRLFSEAMNSNGTNDGGLLSMLGPILISGLLLIIYELATLLPEIAIMLRRLRDTGMAEQWAIALVVARFVLTFIAMAFAPLQILNFILGIVVLILMIMPTDKFKKQA